MEELEKHIANLKEYCETDKRLFNDYMESDFTKFCGGHIADIEAVTTAYEDLKKEFDILDHECSRLEKSDIVLRKIIFEGLNPVELLDFVNELEYNQEINKKEGLENRVDIEYIIRRLKDILGDKNGNK